MSSPGPDLPTSAQVRPSRSRSRRILALAVLGVVVLLAAVWVTARVLPDPPADRTGPPLRLWATVEQDRTDEVARTVEVALRNDGPRPVWVTGLQLELPSFAGAGGSRKEALLPTGGGRVDVPMPFGTGRCPAAAQPASQPSGVLVEAHAEGGPTTRLRLAFPHPNPLLDRLLRYDCQQERLGRAATVTFAPWQSRPDGTLLGAVLVQRVGGDTPVTLEDLAGSIMVTLRPMPAGPVPPLGVLAAGQSRLAVPVLADAGRCDAHAIAETKKPFVFPAWLSLGDGESSPAGGEKVPTTVAVTDVDRSTLDDMIRRRCKLPS